MKNNSQDYREKEKRVVDYLREEYFAKAIIFVGSRAVGDWKPQSDWDIFVFTDKKNIRDERYIDYNISRKEKFGLDGEDFDLKFVSTKQKFDWKVFGLQLRFCKIMFDTKNLAKKVVAQAKKEYAKGPQVTKKWALGRKTKAKRYMKKFEDNLDANEYAQLFNRICWHFTEDIFNWWFKMRYEWPLHPQNKFNYIKKKDPKFFAQLKIIYSDKTSYKRKVEAFRKIHEGLFESKEYKRLVK